MGLSDVFPIFIVGAALWVLVYCVLMAQKCFVDRHYQEIQPGHEGEHPEHGQEHGEDHENHNKHDHNERTFFAYYL